MTYKHIYDYIIKIRKASCAFIENAKIHLEVAEAGKAPRQQIRLYKRSIRINLKRIKLCDRVLKELIPSDPSIMNKRIN